MKNSTLNVKGLLNLKVSRQNKDSKFSSSSLISMLYYSSPLAPNIDWKIRKWKIRNFPNIWRGLWRISLARLFKIPTYFGTLEVVVQKANGEVLNYGLVSTRVVTDVGVGFIVDAFQNITEVENMKYHGIGTGSTSEDQTDTALVTELTTEYATDNTRPTGTTAEGATANIFSTVATNNLDGTPGAALREHGIFDQAANSGGVLLDRTVFSAITLSSGDSLQTTYQLTFTAGG
jgi:hypothetical protein